MIAIGLGIGAPKLADDAVGGHIVHGRAPHVFVMKILGRVLRDDRIDHPEIANIALQQTKTVSRKTSLHPFVCNAAKRKAPILLPETILIYFMILPRTKNQGIGRHVASRRRGCARRMDRSLSGRHENGFVLRRRNVAGSGNTRCRHGLTPVTGVAAPPRTQQPI